MSDSVQGRLLCGALRNPRCTIDSFVLLCLVWFCAPRPPGRGAGRRGAARRRGRGPPPVVPTAHRGAQCRRSTQWEPPAALPMSAGRVLHGLESPAAPLCLRQPARRRRGVPRLCDVCAGSVGARRAPGRDSRRGAVGGKSPAAAGACPRCSLRSAPLRWINHELVFHSNSSHDSCTTPRNDLCGAFFLSKTR